MKKVFINLLVAVLISGFTPATPANSTTWIKNSKISKAYVSASYEIKQKHVEFEIHPLDILAFKFD